MQLDIVMRLSRAWNRVDNDLSSPCRPHMLLLVGVLALALALVPALVLALVLVLVLALELVFLLVGGWEVWRSDDADGLPRPCLPCLPWRSDDDDGRQWGVRQRYCMGNIRRGVWVLEVWVLEVWVLEVWVLEVWRCDGGEGLEPVLIFLLLLVLLLLQMLSQICPDTCQLHSF